MQKYHRDIMKNVITIASIVFLLTIIAGCSSGQPTSLSTTTIVLSMPESTSVVDTRIPAKAVPTESLTPVSTATGTSRVKPTHTTRLSPVTPTATTTPQNSKTATPTRTVTPTLNPNAWKLQPIIPIVSDRVVQIYQRGLELGNNPHGFSKIGDCGSTPAWFLGDFDRGPRYYRLGEYQDLAAVIEEFKGSFDRTSLAARSGFNASALFTPLWSDLAYCQSDEAPLACEYRVHRPIIAFIMLGTNDVWHPEEFEPQMRKIIEYSIENGVIPILATKADNQEKNHGINAAIAQLALEYDIPLWNFWRAVDPLPDHGLQEDLVHLTWGGNFFDEPGALTKAWPLRNLTALQTLDAIWRKATSQTQ